jgi:hypothetical protein
MHQDAIRTQCDPTMADTPPDRLSADPRNPHHNAAALERGVGIRFNSRERDDVEEYSVSEGWIRVRAGKAVDRYGRPMTIKLTGIVEAYYRS